MDSIEGVVCFFPSLLDRDYLNIKIPEFRDSRGLVHDQVEDWIWNWIEKNGDEGLKVKVSIQVLGHAF